MQKHLCSNVQGSITINKYCMADLTDLIRLSPNSSRVLMLIFAHIDSNNSLITNTLTLGTMLGLSEIAIEKALYSLADKYFIELHKVKLAHKNKIMKYIHNKKLWYESNRQIWEVIDTKPLTTITLNNEYIKITVNDDIVKVNDNDKDNNILLHVHKNLYYDKNIKNDEILWER